jgi:hypothetical protein
MKTVVIYESMYGNTHVIAEGVAEAARRHGEVVLVPVSGATADVIAHADLVIVGGPTHGHGMSWAPTRRTAVEDAAKHDELELDPDAEGPGLRDWFHEVDKVDGTPAVAFDTRFDAAPAFTGRASVGISRRLRHHGFREIAKPESFLVDKENHLIAGEAERAERWASELFEQLQQAAAAASPSSAS